MDVEAIYEQVRDHYSTRAKVSGTDYGHTVAKAFGYTEAELELIPKEANLGLSCGNPMVRAKLREGETVVDLGCGAGFDVFLAAGKVSENGRVIGVDMNEDMLGRATQNRAKVAANNVSFVESKITNVDLPSGIADCIISNCVVNLVPTEEKQRVFNEMYRLLKPGGRVAISDILAKKPLPDDLKRNMALYVGCIAGASQVEDYQKYLREAGFQDAVIIDNKHDLNVYSKTDDNGNGESTANGCCETKSRDCCVTSEPQTGKETGEPTADGCCGETCCGANEVQPANECLAGAARSDIDFNEWAGSFQVYAIKG